MDKIQREQVQGLGFLLSKHADSLLNFCREYDGVITVRHAGALTLRRIKEQFPCKGHEILDKSIKPKSLKELIKRPKEIYPYGNQKIKLNKRVQDIQISGGEIIQNKFINTLNNRIEKANDYIDSQKGSNNIDYSLMGFIGRWNAVYDSGKRKVMSLDGLYSLNNEKNGLNFKEITKGNKSNAPSVWYGKRQLYTGDYDLHDIMLKNKKSPSRILPKYDFTKKSDTNQKSTKSSKIVLSDGSYLMPAILKKLKDCCKQENSDPRYCSIRHGPQSAYLNYCTYENEPPNPALLYKDMPLLAIMGFKTEKIGDAGFYLLRNANELNLLRKHCKYEMKVVAHETLKPVDMLTKIIAGYKHAAMHSKEKEKKEWSYIAEGLRLCLTDKTNVRLKRNDDWNHKILFLLNLIRHKDNKRYLKLLIDAPKRLLKMLPPTKKN